MNDAMPKKTLFALGIKACKKLQSTLAGDLVLSPSEKEVQKFYIRECCMNPDDGLYFFGKYVLGFDKLNKRTHKRWARDLQHKFNKHSYLLFLKPRGTYKTTLYGESFLLWVWATISRRVRIFYTSANDALLEEVSNHINSFIGFDSDSLYSYVFGVRRDTKAGKNTIKEINITGRDRKAKGNSLMFRTSGGSTNGVHPHLVIVDDPMDKDDRESRAIRDKKKRWLDSLNPLLVPFQWGDKIISHIVGIATRWHLDDCVQYLMDINESIIEDDKKFHIEVESAYTEEGGAAFPEILPLEKLKELRQKVDPTFFSCQYLNEPLPEGAQIFNTEDLKLKRLDQVDISLGTNYCFFDPSQGKQASDYPAVIWFNLNNGQKFMFDAIDKKIKLNELLGLIAKKNKAYNVRVMVYETNGTTLLENRLYELHNKLDHHFYVEAVHETRNKHERITAMQPDLVNGDYFFREDWKKAYPEAINQIVYFPVYKHDDFPDIVEKAVTYFDRFIPSEFIKSSSKAQGLLKSNNERIGSAGRLKSVQNW